jgi:hypothetical protein
MAFNPGIDNEDDDKAAEQGGTDQLGGSSGVISGQTADEGAAQKGKGSGFVNIGSYLDANKADIPGQTDAALGKLGEKYTAATNSVKASQDAFNTAADQNQGAHVEGAANKEEAQKIIGDNLRNDNEIDENDRSTWASYANSAYKGPKELDNAFQPEATEAKDWSNTLTDTNGYFPMMGKMFGQGRSDYSTGMQRLDGSLIAADKDSRQKFNTFNQTASAGLDNTVNSARDAATQKAGQYQAEADWTQQAARDALEKDVLPEYMKGLTGKVAEMNKQRWAEFEAAKQGGGDSRSFEFDNPNIGTNSEKYYNFEMSPNSGYVPTEHLTGSYSNPYRSDFVSAYGGDVGIGALDPKALSKLEALYGMSGSQSLRDQLESEAAATLGFDDVMKGGGLPSYTFNQTGYDQAVNQAMTAAKQQAIASENDRMNSDLAAQQAALAELEKAIAIQQQGQIDPNATPTNFRIPSGRNSGNSGWTPGTLAI